MNVLFVCTGNTCRSPMAEALLKYKDPTVEVASAGIFSSGDNHVNQYTIDVLTEDGIPIDNLKSQPVTIQLLQWADVILTMTTQHKQTLIIQFPHYQDKYFTLKEYTSETDKDIWHELKKTYAGFEEKRTSYIEQNRRKLDQRELESGLHDYVESDIARIEKLEANLVNYNVSDPFGGTIDTYKETLQELHLYIDLLIEKMKN